MLPSPMNVCETHGKVIQPQHEDKASAGTQETMIRPLNAFILWSYHQRQIKSFDNLCACAINKHLTAEWKRLADEEKQPYIDEANRLEGHDNSNFSDYKNRTPLLLNPLINPLLASVVPHRMPLTSLPISNNQEFRPNPPENRSNLLTARIPTYGMPSAGYPAIPKDANTQCAKSLASTSSAAHYTETGNALPCEYKFDNFVQKAKKHKLNPTDPVHSNASNPSFTHQSCFEPQQSDQEYPLDLSIQKDQ